MRQDLQVDDGSSPPSGRSARLALFGPPPLIDGDDGEAYDEILARIRGVVKPADALEEIWVRDAVDLAARPFWQNEASNGAVIELRQAQAGTSRPPFGRAKPFQLALRASSFEIAPSIARAGVGHPSARAPMGPGMGPGSAPSIGVPIALARWGPRGGLAGTTMHAKSEYLLSLRCRLRNRPSAR